MTMTRGSAKIAAEGYMDREGDGFGQNNRANFGRGRGYYKKREKQEDGKYKSVRCSWIELPPGTFINTQHNRTATAVNGMGTKVWDTVAYGNITGSFDISFQLDYQYLHMLKFIFEGTEYSAETGDPDTIKYTFKKVDNKRIRSFTIKRSILNEMAGGPLHSDEIEQLVGCVIVNASFSRSAGNSNISVGLTGFYADERMWKGTLEHLEYCDYDGKLCEYMCVLVADKKDASVEDCDYVANTESMGIQIGNAAERVFSACSPIASSYFEGKSNYKISTSIYSNNPEVYKQRVYGGGTQVIGVPRDDDESYIIRPKIKGCAPLGTMKLLTYDGTASNVDDMGFPSKEELLDAFNKSKNSLCITVDDAVLKSMTWPKGDGQKVTDNLSSQDCKRMTFDFTICVPHGETGYIKHDVYDMCEDYQNKPYLLHAYDEDKLIGPKDW